MSSSPPSRDSTPIERRALLLAALAVPAALTLPAAPAVAGDDRGDFVSCVYAPVEGDELYFSVVRVVSHRRRVSTSWIQRAVQFDLAGNPLGYNLCASMLERMERDGIVGPIEPDNRRQVLIAPIGPPPAADPPRGAIAMASPFGILHRL